MKPSGELYELIKSLTPHEKRYFKITSSVQKGDKLYLKLFDLIDKQKVYDESSLKAAFRGSNPSGGFAFTKNYLSGLLIKNLLAFHTGSSVDANLSRLYERSRIFYARSLFIPYFKSLKKGKELALKYERFGFALEFLEMERQLVKKDRLKTGIAEKFYEEELSIIEKAKQINEIRKLVSLLLNFRRRIGIIRNKKEESELNAILKLEIFTGDYLSLTANERGLFAMYLHAFMKGDFSGARKFAEMRLKLITKNSQVFENSFPGLRDDARMDLIDAYLAEGRNAMAAGEAVRFRRENGKSVTGKINLAITDFRLKLSRSATMKQSDFRKLTEEIEEFLNLSQGKITVHTENKMFYELAKLCFERREIRLSEQIILKLLSKKNLTLVAEFGVYARMLRLLILYESGKKNMFAFHAESALKTFHNWGKIYEPERSIITALKKITRYSKHDDAVNGLEMLRKSLMKIKKDSPDARAFVHVDYIKWIDSLIHRQEVSENMCLI